MNNITYFSLFLRIHINIAIAFLKFDLFKINSLEYFHIKKKK